MQIAMERPNEVQPGLGNPWWLILLWGIATLIIGAYMFARPGVAALTLVQFMGAYWLVGGIFDGISLVMHRNQPRWGWHLLGAILSIVAGIFILSSPLMGAIVTATFLFYLLAFSAIANGLINIFAGNLLRVAGVTSWSWGRFLLGLLQIVIGLFWLWHPLAGALAMVPVLGLFAIITGLLAIVLSFQIRRLI